MTWGRRRWSVVSTAASLRHVYILGRRGRYAGTCDPSLCVACTRPFAGLGMLWGLGTDALVRSSHHTPLHSRPIAVCCMHPPLCRLGRHVVGVADVLVRSSHHTPLQKQQGEHRTAQNRALNQQPHLLPNTRTTTQTVHFREGRRPTD